MEEKKKKQSRAWVSSKRKNGEVCGTFYAFCVLSWACTWPKFSQSHQECWLIFLRWPTCYLSPQVLAVACLDHQLPPTSVDYSLMSTTLFYRLALVSSASSSVLLGPSFPRPLPVSWEVSRTCPLCGFHTKTDKGIFWLALTHTHTANGQHCVTLF